MVEAVACLLEESAHPPDRETKLFTPARSLAPPHKDDERFMTGIGILDDHVKIVLIARGATGHWSGRALAGTACVYSGKHSHD